MTREEIDILWQKALHDSVKDGEQFTRYHFARAIADLQKEKDGNILAEAMQSDLENGVKWLNENAAKEFHDKYPALSAAIGEINSPETDLDEALRRQ